MNFHVLTLFPDMIEAGLHTSVTGRALKNGYIHLSAVNIRDYSKDKHKHVDDYPYGGGAGMVMQITVFVVVSAVLVIFTRPFAAKYVNVHHVKTNCDELIGSVVKVTETVDNFAQTGTAIAQGKEWTARCKSDKDRIEKDSLAKVTAISGVKLILEKCKEDEL